MPLFFAKPFFTASSILGSASWSLALGSLSNFSGSKKYSKGIMYYFKNDHKKIELWPLVHEWKNLQIWGELGFVH